MKKIVTLKNNIQNAMNRAYIAVKTVIENKKAEMYVDKSVGVIISVVVGALILGGVYGIAKSVMDTADTTVTNMFDYAA